MIEAANYLAKYYRIKNGKLGPREWWQYYFLYTDLMKHLPDMQKEQENVIVSKRIEFTAKFGIQFN